ncbi:MAG TPA: TIGR03619 family F420-dependent LLM class oxidoreductase [Acidimicrobiia bacterium]|nr:TIGR03619 family F420-dependent LLM class oxidoreductase [Acidimicrobiia bacterium]
MKFGLFGLHRGPGIAPDVLARRARAAEDAGFESLWVGDHIALPSGLPGAEEPRLEALATLFYLAAVTSKVRLAAGVLVIPQRNPVLLAKQLTSLDVLSEGRLIVGVGVGHIEGELAALGVPMSARGSRTDDGLARIRELWAGARARGGRGVDGEVVQFPAPVQDPHPPIVVGGHSRAALARAAGVGNGWFGWLTPPDRTRELIQHLEDFAESQPRPAMLGPLEITVAAPGQVTVDVVDAYERIGVSRLVVGPDTVDGNEPDRFIDSFYGSVLAHQPTET